MLSKRLVQRQVANRKTLRKIDPLTLKPKDVNRVTDIIIDQCKSVVEERSAPEFDYCWLSNKTIKKRNIVSNFRPIGKLDRITDTIIDNLQLNFPIEIRHTINKGPEYIYYTSKKHRWRGDWICIPEPFRFKESKFYYKTLLHELSHAACSRTRLCLKFSEDEEEVSVEAASLIVCFLSGYNLWNSCLGYMIDWSYDKQGNPSITRKSQWEGIKSKTKRIVRYLLYGTDRI